MKKHVFIIGPTDAFISRSDLIEAYYGGTIGGRFAQVIEFELPDGTNTEVVQMYAYGLAFMSDWCMDDTVSYLVPSRTRLDMSYDDCDGEDSSEGDLYNPGTNLDAIEAARLAYTRELDSMWDAHLLPQATDPDLN